MKGFTEKELEILGKLEDAHNLYVELEQTHPSDIKDWANSIHDLQKLIAIRTTRRDYPSIFKTIKN